MGSLNVRTVTGRGRESADMKEGWIVLCVGEQRAEG